jgi:ribosomal protein L22, bacterial type
MEAKSYLYNIRISPRKVKIVLDLIRGKEVAKAAGILKNTPKSASEYLIKLLNRAVADAENNFEMNRDNLYVSECFVTPGITLKRRMPRGKGSCDIIHKRSSHITLAVKEKN